MSDPWGDPPPPLWPDVPYRRPSRPGYAVLAWFAIVVVIAAFVGVSFGRRLHSTPVDRQSTALIPGGLSRTAAAVAAAVDPALVDVNTTLAYQGAMAAGTGMILTPTGEVLTNNHVIAGATTVTATVIGTGRTYAAKVVGTSRTADIAVLQLEGAPRLPTITIGDASSLSPGDDVVAIGNAGGIGGTPSVVDGRVRALGQTITASNDDGSGAEQLDNLIETTAPIQPGDSGGPLLNTAGQVVGMDTAAATGPRTFAHSGAGFAIPITQAMAVARQIESGHASPTIQIGPPAFLGVRVDPTAPGPGAVVEGIVNGSPAANAGIRVGDAIVDVDASAIASAGELTPRLRAHRPGDRVKLTWRRPDGSTRQAIVALIAGPAD